MSPGRHLASSVLLAAGIVLTFTGLSSALGFTTGGMIASVAAIAALLYAGGTWLGGAPGLAPAGAGSVLLFDRSLRVASGATPGAFVMAQFPEPIRPEIEAHCRAALRGEHAHFVCEHRNARFVFDVAPVQSVDGVVLYGVLMTGAGVRQPGVPAAPMLTPV